MSLIPDLLGTTETEFSIGQGQLLWLPTAPRSIAFPDASGTVMLQEQYDPGQVIDIICNCISGSQLGPYIATGFSSGTIAVGNQAAVDANRPFAIKLRLGTTTNGGARITTDSTIRLLRPTLSSFWVNFNLITNSTFRMGLHTTITSADATDGCYWEIINNGTITTVLGKIANNSVRSQTVGVAPVLNTGAQDWYRFDVLVSPDPNTPANSTATFTIRDKTLASIFAETIGGVNIPTVRQVAAGIVASNTGIAATDLCHVHQIRTRISGVVR